MINKNIRLTKRGLDKIKNELKNLKERHIKLSKLWRSNRSDTDEVQHSVELLEHADTSRHIEQLENILRKAKPISAIDMSQTDKVVGLGNIVLLKSIKGEKKVTLVESIEADPFSGFISEKSPLGQAVFGRQVGEKAVVESPKGNEEYTILNIS
jgi:transcription elongation factor GreA